MKVYDESGNLLAQGRTAYEVITNSGIVASSPSQKYWFTFKKGTHTGSTLVSPNINGVHEMMALSTLSSNTGKTCLYLGTLGSCKWPTYGCHKEKGDPDYHIAEITAHPMSALPVWDDEIGTIKSRSGFALSAAKTRTVYKYVNGVSKGSKSFKIPTSEPDAWYSWDLSFSAKTGYVLDKSKQCNDDSTTKTDKTGCVVESGTRYNVYFLTQRDATAVKGTGISSVSGSATAVTYGNSVKFNASVSTGYTWDGWYDGSTKKSSDKEYTFTMPGNNVSYTAKATANSYTVTFDPNGGDAVASMGFTIEDELTLPTPVRSGYSFKGWKVTSASGNWSTSSTFAAGTTVPAGKYGNVTLQAQWELPPLTITASGLTSMAIFYVKKAGDPSPMYIVELTPARPSVSIKMTEVATWEVSPTGWSWNQNVQSGTNTGPVNFSFDFSQKTGTPVSAEHYRKNW